jgi:hypothetical protein
MAYEISPPQGFFKVGEELKRAIYTLCHCPIFSAQTHISPPHSGD